MMKVLVLGSSGMAGHVITKFFEESGQYEVSNLAHRLRLNSRTVLLDAADQRALEDFLDGNSFDGIINCIGVLNKAAEEEKDRAVLLNSYLPHFLEYRYRGTATRIIHISTDCVFSGRAGKYTEASFRDGDSFYARTKAVGEIVNDKDLTLRTSIIGPDINPKGIGLFNWFMASRGEIGGYINTVWTGVTNLELAKAIKEAISTGLTGLYHLTGTESITKCRLLELFKEKLGREDVSISRVKNMPNDKSLVCTRKDFRYKVPAYEDMVEGMIEWIAAHKELYPHYLLPQTI